MIVYVNNEERELHVYDRSSGVDYAKSVICSQERLDTGVMGEFILSEQEYDNWKEILHTGIGRYPLCHKRYSGSRRIKRIYFRRYTVSRSRAGNGGNGKCLPERTAAGIKTKRQELAPGQWIYQNNRAYLVRKNPCQYTHVVISLNRCKIT